MTLAKAVEALRYLTDGGIDLHVGEVALASLPKPMAEEEIMQLIWNKADSNFSPLSVIRALKSAGCLYVKEDK